MNCRRTRIVDSVTAAQRQGSRVKRAVSKTYSWAKVIPVNVRKDALADVWHLGQVVQGDHIPCLYEAPEGWADRVAACVQLHSWLIQCRVESSNGTARFVRRKVQLVAQAQIDGDLLRQLPVVLEKETVVIRAQEACVDSLCIHRVGGETEQEIVKALEAYLAAPVVIRRHSSPVIDDPAARADAVTTSLELLTY